MWPFDEEESTDSNWGEFNTVAQTIAQEAPDINTGLSALRDAFGSYEFQDKERARSTLEDFSRDVRLRFDDNKPFDEAQVLEMAPVPFDALKPSGTSEDEQQLSIIDQWQTGNLESVKNSEDPIFMQGRDQFERGINTLAAQKRREIVGKDNYIATDVILRGAKGVLNPLESNFPTLHDWFVENTDPDNDTKYWAGLAEGAGFTAGAVAASAVPGGAVAYIGAGGLGAASTQYREAVQQGASTEDAIGAAAIEGASQTAQAYLGGKLVNKVGGKLWGKTAMESGERVIPGAALTALEGTGLAVAGNVASNVAQNVGAGEDADTDVLRGTFQTAMIAAPLGFGVAAAAGKVQANRTARAKATEPTTPLVSENVIQDIDGTPPPAPEAISDKLRTVEPSTDATPIYEMNNGGKVIRDGDTYHYQREGKTQQSYDSMYHVDPEVAAKVNNLVNKKAPDNTEVTLTVRDGQLVARSTSKSLNDDLTINRKGQGKSEVIIPTKTEGDPNGSGLILASKTRTTILKNGKGVRVNPSYVVPETVAMSVGSDSAGAMSTLPSRLMKERGYAKNLREALGPEKSEQMGLTSTGIDLSTGKVTTTPLSKYFVTTVREGKTVGETYVDTNGVEAAYNYLARKQDFTYEDQGIAYALVQRSKVALENAIVAQDAKSIEGLAKMRGEAEKLYAATATDSAQILAFRSNADRTRNRVADIDAANIVEAGKQIEAEFGKDASITKLDEQATVLEAEAAKVEAEVTKTLKPKKTKDGTAVETKPSPEQEAKINEAKKTATEARAKVEKAKGIMKEKLDRLPPEDRKNLNDWYAKLNTTKDGFVRRKLATAIFETESKHIPDDSPELVDSVYSFWVRNVLSGPDTQARNLYGNLSSLVTQAAGQTLMNPRAGFQYIHGALTDGLSRGLNDFALIMSGKKAGRNKFDFTPSAKEKGDVQSIAREPTNDKVNPYRWYNVVNETASRMLSATDAVFFRSAQEGQVRLLEYLSAKQAGIKPAERADWVQNKLYNTKQKLADITKEVEAEAATLKAAGIEMSPREKQAAIFERAESMRAETAQLIGNRHGEVMTFRNEVEGVIGAMTSGLTEALTSKYVTITRGNKKFQPFRFLGAFLNTAGNVSNMLLNHTPVGFARAGLSKAEIFPKGIDTNIQNRIDALKKAGKVEEAHALRTSAKAMEERAIMAQAIMGTTLMAGMFGWAYENPEFVEFYGPETKDNYKERKANNIPPYSVRFGKSIVGLQNTPLALLPAILGPAMDGIKNGKDPTKVAKTVAGAGFGAAATMSFLKPLGDLYNYMSGVGESNDKEESGKTELKNQNQLYQQISNFGKGFIPSSGFLQNVARWMNEEPTDSYNNFQAKMLGQMPFARDLGIGKPQLNMFGEPLKKDLLDRTAIGSFFTSVNKDPTIQWMTDTGYTMSDQGPVLTLTTNDQKAVYGKTQEARTGYADVMDEVQSREVLEISGPKIRAYLERVRELPGFNTFNKNNQEIINRNINSIRAAAKLQVLGKEKKLVR